MNAEYSNGRETQNESTPVDQRSSADDTFSNQKNNKERKSIKDRLKGMLTDFIDKKPESAARAPDSQKKAKDDKFTFSVRTFDYTPEKESECDANQSKIGLESDLGHGEKG